MGVDLLCCLLLLQRTKLGLKVCGGCVLLRSLIILTSWGREISSRGEPVMGREGSRQCKHGFHICSQLFTHRPLIPEAQGVVKTPGSLVIHQDKPQNQGDFPSALCPLLPQGLDS